MASRTRLPSKISGQVVKVSGEHVFVESGVHVVVPDVSVSGSIVQISGQGVLISGQHVFVESGVHAVVESGLGVSISGQHVYVESGTGVVTQSGIGVVPTSGIGVQIQSGAGVLISGQHVFVESGVNVVAQSGLGVIINSGVGVTVQSGVILLSGVINATWLSGLYFASGQSLVSGQGVIVGTATLSGLRLISGQSVTIDPATLSGLRLISGQSVTVASGLGVLISGQHVYVESGVSVIAQSGLGVLISGQLTTQSGIGVTIQSGAGVLISGQHVFVESGVNVVAQSGLGVLISGQHVYVESGVIVASGLGVVTQSGVIVASGLGVLISGQHVFVESGVIVASGLNVVVQSGLGVLISGQMVQQASGAYDASGVGVIINSGVGVTVASGLGVLISGQHVYVESGVIVASGLNVVVQSGLGVLISGQHVFVESGVNVVAQSGLGVLISGQHVFVESGVNVIVGSGVGVLVSGVYISPELRTSGYITALFDLSDLVGEETAFTECWEWTNDQRDRQQIFYRKYCGRGYPYSPVWKTEASGLVPESWTMPPAILATRGDDLPWLNALMMTNSKDGATVDELYVGSRRNFRPPCVMRILARIPDVNGAANGACGSGTTYLFGFENNRQGGQSIAACYVTQSNLFLRYANITPPGLTSGQMFNRVNISGGIATIWGQDNLTLTPHNRVESTNIPLQNPDDYANYYLDLDPPFLRLWQASSGNLYPFLLSEAKLQKEWAIDDMQAFIANESEVVRSGYAVAQWTVYERVPKGKYTDLLMSGASIGHSGVYLAGSGGSGSSVSVDLDCAQFNDMALTYQVSQMSNMIAPTRLYVLGMCDQSGTVVDSENLTDAFAYLEPMFISGQLTSSVKTVNVDMLPRYARLLLRNLAVQSAGAYRVYGHFSRGID